MKLLALETATEACSAALYLDGEVTERYEIAPRGHTELILPMVEGLLSDAGMKPTELDVIAFGRGPGAFTGVRIAVGVVQGIAYALDLPVVPVSTLAVLAQGGRREFGWDHVAAAIDARMGEVYWGSFVADEGGVMQPLGDELVCPPAEVPLLHEHQWHGIGSGWQTYATELGQRQGVMMVDAVGDYFPHARDTATLAVAAFKRGEAVSAEQALPRYIRDQVAHKPK